MSKDEGEPYSQQGKFCFAMGRSPRKRGEGDCKEGLKLFGSVGIRPRDCWLWGGGRGNTGEKEMGKGRGGSRLRANMNAGDARQLEVEKGLWEKKERKTCSDAGIER